MSAPFRPMFNASQPPGVGGVGGVRPYKPTNSFYVFQPRPPAASNYQNAADFDGKRLRKAVARKTTDYNSSVVRMLEARVWQRDYRDMRALQPDVAYYTEVCFALL